MNGRGISDDLAITYQLIHLAFRLICIAADLHSDALRPVTFPRSRAAIVSPFSADIYRDQDDQHLYSISLIPLDSTRLDSPLATRFETGSSSLCWLLFRRGVVLHEGDCVDVASSFRLEESL